MMYYSRFSAIGLAGALWFGMGSAALAVGEGPSIVERWATESQDSRFWDFSYDQLTHDDSLDRTVLSDVTLTYSLDFRAFTDFPWLPKIMIDLRIAISELDFIALREDASRYYADEYGASDISMTFAAEDFSSEADTQFSVEDFETLREALANVEWDISSYVQTKTDWAKIPKVPDDPERPVSRFYPILAALFDVNAEGYVVGPMTMIQSFEAGLEDLTEYEGITAENLVDGNAERVIYGAMRQTVRSTSGTDQTLQWELATASAAVEAYNVANFVRALDPAAPLSVLDTPYNIFVGSYAQPNTNGVASDGSVSFSIENVDVLNTGVRPPSVPFLTKLDDYYLQAVRDLTAFQDEQYLQDVLKTFAALYGMFNVGEMSLENITVDAPAIETSVKLERVLMESLSQAGLGQLAFDGLSLDNPGVSGQLQRFAYGDLRFPTLDALIGLEEATSNNDIPAILRGIPKLGFLELLGVDASTPLGPVALDAFTIRQEGYVADVPSLIALSVDRFRMPVAPLEPQVKDVLEALGYDAIDASFSYQINWEDAAEALRFNSTAQLKDGGQYEDSIAIDGVPRRLLEDPSIDTAQSVLPFLTFLSAAVSYQDDSLVERAVEAAAAIENTTPAQIRQQVLGMLPFALEMLDNPDFVAELQTVAEQVMGDGSGFLITMTPDSPVSLLQIGAGGATAPGVLIDLLNVAVEAQ